MFVRSPLLTRHGFAHGFSTREEGVSKPPYDSLNLGRGLGDEPKAVAENHQRLTAALEVPIPFEVQQEHTARVVLVEAAQDRRALQDEVADALVTLSPAISVAVRTADCVPVLLADPETGRVAAVHAGWRGVAASIVGATLSHFADPRRVLAAIGPHISVQHFEVGAEVAAELQALAPELDCVDASRAKPHVNLGALVRWQLADAGVRDESVDAVEACTYAEPRRFFSYRRDGAQTGRMLSVIASSA